MDLGRCAAGGTRGDPRRDGGSGDVGVEPELVGADAQYITASQNLHPLDPVPVDEQAVRAGVRDHVSGVARDDLGVTPGDVRRRDDDVASGVAPEDQPGQRHHVLAAVDQ